MGIQNGSIQNGGIQNGSIQNEGIQIGINLEYVRHADKSLAWGVKKAAEIGYRYVEPCFLLGRCLLSNAGYCHVTSMDTDPQRIKTMMDEAGVRISALSTHSDLLSPEFGVLYARKVLFVRQITII